MKKNIFTFVVASLVILLTLFWGQHNIGYASKTNDEFEIDVNHVLTGYHGIGGNVKIPKGVKTIGRKAFAGLTNITSVEIPKGVTCIEVSAFDSCTNLQSVVLPEGLLTIGDSAFWGCTLLKDIAIPSSVQEIGYGAFCNCDVLTGMEIPSGVKSIGAYAIGYLFIGADYVPAIDYTIIGSDKSSASEYAKNNHIHFISKDMLHVTVKKISSPSVRKITVAFEKNKLVDGYRIEYSTDKSFKKAKMVQINSSQTSKKTISKLSSKKKYYVRIQGYKKINGREITSSWSKINSITVK